MSKKYAKHIRLFFLGLGILLFAGLVKKIGIAAILESIDEIGWLFIPVLALSFGWFILYTYAWLQFLQRLSDGIKFWELFRIKVAGETVNTLTPANFMGGDPLRIYLLRKNFPYSEGAASVVVDRTLATAGTLVVIIVSIVVAFFKFDALPWNIKFGVPAVLLVSAAFITFVLIHQRRGFFGLIMTLLMRLKIKKNFSDNTIRRFNELDSHIIDFYRQNHRGFIVAFVCHIICRVLGIFEVYIVGKAVSSEFTFFAALVLGAVAPLINAIFAFVPGAFGVLEGAFSGVLYLMHFNPAIGITIQIAKRLRSLFWIVLGLVFLGAHDRKKVWEEEKLLEEV